MPNPVLVESLPYDGTGTEPAKSQRPSLNRRLGNRQLRRLIDMPRSSLSAVWNRIIDSTGAMNDNTNFTSSYHIDKAIAALAVAEGWRVEQRVVRTGVDTNTIYDYYQTKVLAPGSAGPRGIQWGAPGAGVAPLARSRVIVDHIQRTSDDLEFIIGFQPATLTPAAQATLINVNNNPTNGGYFLSQQTSGLIRLTWFDSTNAARTADFDPAALGVTTAVVSWLRFRMDVDNGSGGYTLTAQRATQWYTTTDSVVPEVLVWGAAVAPTATSISPTAGVTSIQKASGLMEMGGRGGSATGGGNLDPWQGTIYGFYPKNGFDGGILCSVNIEDWTNTQGGKDNSNVDQSLNSNFVGSPTLYTYNGGSPGKDITWALGLSGTVDAERPARLVVPGATVVTLGDGHNEVNRRGSALRALLDQITAVFDARCPGAVKHAVIQNPQSMDHTGRVSAGQRSYEISAYLGSKGYQITDLHSPFYTTDQTIAPLSATTQSKNVHPTSLGYQVQAQAYAADLGITAPALVP